MHKQAAEAVLTTLEQSVTIFCTALQLQSVKSEASLSFWQAMKDALTVQELTDQLQAALTAAHDKAGAEAAAAAQHAQVHQQQLDAFLADHTASVENTKVTLSSLCTYQHDQISRKSMSLQDVLTLSISKCLASS